MNPIAAAVTTIGVILGITWATGLQQPATPSTPLAGDDGPCRGGCKAHDQVRTEASPARIRKLLREIHNTPPGEPSHALDELLFARRDIDLRRFRDDIDASHFEFLRNEMAKDRVRLGLRLVDHDGRIRGRLSGALLPFGEKQHLIVRETDGLPAFELSGTVHRVSRDDVWSRW